jgi:hypothetical protein
MTHDSLNPIGQDWSRKNFSPLCPSAPYPLGVGGQLHSQTSMTEKRNDPQQDQRKLNIFDRQPDHNSNKNRNIAQRSSNEDKHDGERIYNVEQYGLHISRDFLMFSCIIFLFVAIFIAYWLIIFGIR